MIFVRMLGNMVFNLGTGLILQNPCLGGKTRALARRTI